LHAQKCSDVDKPLENIPVSSNFLVVSRSLNMQTFVMIDTAFSQKLESDVGIYMLPAEQSMFFGSLYPPFDQVSDFPKSSQGQQYRWLDERLLVTQLYF
jgi:hypothetical protein